jgi:CRP-like cAMP-binding protein
MPAQTGLGKLIAESGTGAASGHGRTMGREAVGMLAEIPLFSSLSRRHLGRVASCASRKRYAPHTVLVHRGKPADAFYVILDGTAHVDVPGRKVELRMGDFFGEMALIDGEPRSASVIADSEVVAMIIPRTKFLKLLESEPKLTLSIMATLTRRIRDMQAVATI